MGDGRNSKRDGNESKEGEHQVKEKGLEEALGNQMLQHFQSETMRLQTQNDTLVREL